MRPDDHRPTTPIVVPSRQSSAVSPARSASAQHTEAATEIVRNQINSIYQQDPNLTAPASANNAAQQNETVPRQAPAAQQISTTSAQQPGPGAINIQAANQQTEVENPYERTHNEQQHQIQVNSWQKYHSAWQSYYQQYYERYYVGQVHAAKQSLAASAHLRQEKDETISTDEAMYDLRSRLRSRINTRAKNIRKSRHFMPIVAAIVVMLGFLFLQYNRVLFSNVSAYITPGSTDPSTIIVDPTASTTVSADPRLIIPKISVDVPIVWDANAASQDSLNAAMDKGVAWFNIQGASAKPGEKGNFVLSGHSSNDWLDKGDYKFIFAPLERMKTGDTVYVNYNSTRYTYTITGSKVVSPTDVSSLYLGTDKPRLTLITCTPLGTALNRLLVFADQVSPDPNAPTTTQSTSSSSSSSASKMPSNSPTFLERLFGISN